MQVQSHAISNVATEAGDMRRNYYFLITLALILFVTLSYGYQATTYENSNNLDTINTISRAKRQIEDLENEDYSTPSAQVEEEPGFWDRIVKVALRLFSRFIEWLNSS